jgi:peptidoglycan/LPS O-acetylase OafA/YrhL
MVSPNASLPAASEGLSTNWTAKPILGPHKTIAEIDFGRNNNFNLIRMFAAICVLVSHAWPIALHGPVAEPLQVLTGYKLGTLSVSIFFATSGYFITKSFDRRSSLPDFILARVARIYPALAVVLILSTIILEFVCGNISFGHYFGQFRTVRYVIVNLLLLKHQYDLPGIFVYNGHPGAINGSIWSLL